MQKKGKIYISKYQKVGNKMYLIVGLGNPEEEYSNTRHNMGFDTVNKLAKQYNIEINKNKFNYRGGKSRYFKTSNLYEFKWRKYKRSNRFL